MPGSLRIPFYQSPPQLAWPAYQWTEPLVPARSSCYKPSRRQGRRGGRLPCWNPVDSQAVATPLCSLIKRADSLGPSRLDLGCSLTCASEQPVYWSAHAGVPRGKRLKGSIHGEVVSFPYPVPGNHPPPPPAVTVRSLSLLSVRGGSSTAHSGSALPLSLRTPSRDEEPCDLRGWGGWRVTWPVSRPVDRHLTRVVKLLGPLTRNYYIRPSLHLG